MKNYDSYKRKILKLRDIRDFLYKFRVLFISIFLTIVTITSTLLGIKGITYETGGFNNVYVYGEKIEPYGKAIFSSVNYEYKKINESSWHKTPPTKTGNYLCRYYTNRAFNLSYSKPVKFTIIPKKISINVVDNNIIYGEKPKIDAKGLCKGDFIEKYDVKYDNIFALRTEVYVDSHKLTIKNYNDEDVTNCYKIAFNHSNILVNKRPLSLSFLGDEKEYDGEPLINNEYKITSGSLADSDRISLSPSKSITEIGSIPNKREVSIFNSENTDVTMLYNISTKDNDLVVKPRHLLIKTNTVSKIYDGNPAVLEYEIIEGSLLNGHSLMASFLEIDTYKIGKYENKVQCRIFDPYNSCEVTQYYDIKYEFGTIDITTRDLCIKTGTAVKVYDGKELFSDEYSFVNNTSLATGDNIIIINHTAIVDNGSVENVLEIDITRNGCDISDCYNITYEYGTLTVKKRPLNVTINHLVKVYDGTPLIGNKYYADNIAPNQTSEAVVYSSLTKVGVKDNEPFEIKIFDNNDVDCTFNYDINYQNGENALEVTKRPLHIKSKSKTKPYDGKPLVVNDFDIIDGTSLAQGDRVEATFENKGFVDNGSIINKMSVNIFNEENEDVTFCYDIQLDFGVLEIEKMHLTVRTSDVSKVYDGEKFTSDDCFTTDEVLPEGHKIIGSVSSDGIDVGTYPLNMDLNNITILNADNKDVTYNFIITFINSGSLTVEKRPITAKPKDEVKFYDGDPLFASDYEIISTYKLVLDHVLVCNYEGSVTDPNDSPVESRIVNPKVISEGTGIDVTNNYDINLETGILNVLFKKITVTSCDYTATYNGQYVDFENYNKYSLDDELIPGHTIEVHFDNTPVKNVVDSRPNKFSCVIYNENHVDITDKYKITKVFGNITINPVYLTVQVNSKTVVYDEAEHSLGTQDYIDVNRTTGEIRIVEGNMVNNEYLQVSSFVKAKDPGDYRTEFKYRIVDDYNNELDPNNYRVNRKYGFLYIKKINLTVESKNGRKVYDGLPFENDIWISTGYLLDGHTFTYTIDENITEIGTHDNLIKDFKIVDANGNDVTDVYYNLTLVNGKIIILDPNSINDDII